MKCPKCSYERQSTDDAPDWQCPSCKVAYVKALQAKALVSPPVGGVEQLDKKQPPLVDPYAELDEHDLRERHSLAARGQKMVIYSILLNLLLRAVDQSHVLPGLVIEVLFVCVGVYSLMGIVKICSGLDKSQNQKILFMVLYFFPLVNLVAVVYLNIKTSGMLREAGWEVGLLGARP